MSNTAKCFFYGVLTFSLSLTSAQAQQAEALSRGAVILAEKTEPVSFLGPDNQPLGKGSTSPGMLLPDGSAVHTGSGGNALLLLSNGSVVTISENTKMKISSLSKNLSKTKDFRWVTWKKNRVRLAYWSTWKSAI